MGRRLGGLRLRLAVAICGVSLAVVAASFFALRETSGAELRDRIDQDLRDQLAEFESTLPQDARLTSASVGRHARRFVASQGYHPSSRIFALQSPGRPLVTNQPDLLEREAEDEHPGDGAAADETAEELGESGLFDAPEGVSTVSGSETGKLRVLTAPIRRGGRTLATFRAADPLEPVEESETELNRAFVVVGLVALLISVGVALAIATVMTRPLRRMARVASAVGEGDLKARIGPTGRQDEIGVLAEAFDRMLDRLDRAFARQREFVSDASHELRTPLTVLRGQVELLDRETDPERRHLTAETVLRELDHMNRLVDEMLTLAASESEALVHREPIELAAFIEDLRRDLPLFGEREYVVSGIHDGTLEADPERLHQVLRNLTRNAVAATRPGDRITINAAADADWLEFSVSDTGPGVPPEELERIFDRFHRTDAARERGENGTGLGLAIAQALVNAHGGWIRAESAPGEGATFRFAVPWYRPPA